MRQRLLEALKHARADYAEIRFEELDSTHFQFRGKDQDGASTTQSTSGSVRACVNGGWCTVHFDTLDDLEEKLRQACQCARLVGNDKTCLAEGPLTVAEFPAEMADDFRQYSLEEKVAAIQAYNQLVLGANEDIESSLTAYTERFRRVHFASTRGACFMEERPFIGLRIRAVARKGDLVQEAFKSIGSVSDFGIIRGHEQDCLDVAKRASDLLRAPKCSGGKTTVILDPSFTGLFTHEAFGHLSEADFLHENKPARELMHIGRRVGPDYLNIVDDGSIPGHMGSLKTDDEGTPTRRNQLVKDGILVGHLHSLETAAKMSEPLSGNARALDGGCPPIVRMTNTFIEPGTWKKEDLFKDVDDGIYACGGLAGQTMMEMFTFTASYGYSIKNGQVTDLLRDVMVTGNVFETLSNIDAIADDFHIHDCAGGCGKHGQSPLPVSDGGPHIRIRNAIVAGDK